MNDVFVHEHALVHGRSIEVVGRKKPFGVLIFHANTPPTARAYKELGLTGGAHGRDRRQ